MNIFHKSLLTDLKKLKKTLEKITIHQNWYWEKNKIEPLIKEIANYIKRFTYHKKRHENIDEIIIRLNELLKMIQIMTSQKREYKFLNNNKKQKKQVYQEQHCWQGTKDMNCMRRSCCQKILIVGKDISHKTKCSI